MAGTGEKRLRTARKAEAAKLFEAGLRAGSFSAAEQERVWKLLLASKNERIQLDAAKYLTDRLYGKARQAVEHTGKISLEQLVTGGNS